MRFCQRLLGVLLVCTLLPMLAPAAVRADDPPVWVPAYPGPVPTSWPSVLQYEQYASERARQLEARQRGLTSAGRSKHYRLLRGALFSAMFVGAAMGIAGFCVLWSRPSEEADTPRVTRAITVLMLAGAGLTLSAGVGAHSLKRRHPHNEEIDRLGQERLYWRREAQRVRRERKRSGFDVSLTGLGLHASF